MLLYSVAGVGRVTEGMMCVLVDEDGSHVDEIWCSFDSVDISSVVHEVHAS